MPKPTVGQSSWGETLNTHLDDIETKANAALPATQKGAASGVAPLDAGSLVPQANLPTHLTPDALSDTIDAAGSFGPTPSLVSKSDQRLTHARYLHAGKLAKWVAAMDAVRAGTRDAKVLVIGDSTSAGVGGNTDATFQAASSWPAFLSDELDRLRYSAAPGLACPRGESAGALADNRWTIGSGWSRASATDQQYFGMGGKYQALTAASGATGSLVYADSRVLADTFDIYYLTQTSASLGTIRATATGGGEGSADTANQASKMVKKLTVTAAAASTANAVTITNTGGPIYVVGVEPSLSTSRKIRVGSGAAAGSNAATWVAFPGGDSTLRWNSIGFIEAYQPDLTIIDLGINDGQLSRAADDVMADIEKLIVPATITGDVILKTMIPSSDSALAALEQTYVDAMLATDYPVVNLFARYGSYAATSAAGLMSDTLHGNELMYEDEGIYLAGALPI